MTTRAAIYVRISLDRTGEALGVERQEKACREFCEQRGWQVAALHVDNDISATTGKRRPGFEALLASRPEVIVVWHTDRLVRLSRDLERVIDLGVNVHAIAAGHVDLSNPAGRAVAKTITAWAQYEGEQKGERMRLANAQRAAAGKPPTGARALGWQSDGVTPHRTEAPIVVKAYDDVLAGLSLRAVAREWNEAGLVTTRGGAWRPDAVRYVLTNPRNAGLRAARDKDARTWRTIGEGLWDGFVSEDTFRATSDLLNDPTRRTTPDTRRKYFLSGLAVCGVCGAPMNTGGTTRPTGMQRTLKCSVSKHLQVASAPVEAWVSEVVIARLSREDAADLLVDDKRPDLSELRADVRSKRARLTQLADLLADGTLTPEAVRTTSARLKADIASAEARMSDSGRADVLGPLVGAVDVRAAWSELHIERKRAVVDALMTVTLRSPGRGRRTFNPDNVVCVPR